MAANAIGALPSAITADSVTRGPDSTSTVTSSRELDSATSGRGVTFACKYPWSR